MDHTNLKAFDDKRDILNLPRDHVSIIIGMKVPLRLAVAAGDDLLGDLHNRSELGDLPHSVSLLL
jgi:hypothetical protein